MTVVFMEDVVKASVFITLKSFCGHGVGWRPSTELITSCMPDIEK